MFSLQLAIAHRYFFHQLNWFDPDGTNIVSLPLCTYTIGKSSRAVTVWNPISSKSFGEEKTETWKTRKNETRQWDINAPRTDWTWQDWCLRNSIEHFTDPIVNMFKWPWALLQEPFFFPFSWGGKRLTICMYLIRYLKVVFHRWPKGRNDPPQKSNRPPKVVLQDTYVLQMIVIQLNAPLCGPE